jgi:hypothetical protein
MLRQHKPILEIINVTKELDVFPKIDDDYKVHSSRRGTCYKFFFIN